MNIGIFDSGLGGLFVMRSIVKKLPQYNYIYLGDTKRVPYGNRSHETILAFTKEALEFLFAHNCSLVILACNSASAQALREIQRTWLPRTYPNKKVLGVIIPTVEEAKRFLERVMLEGVFKDAGNTVVIEEFLEGHELSFMALYDGHDLRVMIGSQDHKQRYEGDTGPMTGGMGAFAPVPWVTEFMIHDFARVHILPLLERLKVDYGITYTGFLYIALMYTNEGFKVLEWNCRPGDPETQAVISLLKSDLADYLMASAKGTLGTLPEFEWHDGKHAVCIALCEDPYPDSPKGGFEITGIDEAEQIDGVTVIHAGTKRTDDGRLVTSGGRVLYVLCIDDTLETAQRGANKAAELIQFQNKVYRTDIGNRARPILV